MGTPALEQPTPTVVHGLHGQRSPNRTGEDAALEGDDRGVAAMLPQCIDRERPQLDDSSTARCLRIAAQRLSAGDAEQFASASAEPNRGAGYGEAASDEVDVLQMGSSPFS